jgi:hypothetical protein
VDIATLYTQVWTAVAAIVAVGGVLVIGATILLAIFLGIRFFWLWYFRVNAALDRLDRIAGALERLSPPPAATGSPSGTPRTPTPLRRTA